MSAVVITISQSKGGACKTTTAINLAGALNEKGHKAIIGDMDKEKPDSFKWMSYGDSIDWVVPINKENPTEEIEKLKSSCKFLILDTPPNYMSAALKAVMLADLVIIPIASSKLDKDNGKDAVAIPMMAKKPFRILMSNIKKGTKEGKALNNPENFDSLKFNTFISNRADMIKCIEEGKWVGDYAKNSDNHLQFLKLAEEVVAWSKGQAHTCADSDEKAEIL